MFKRICTYVLICVVFLSLLTGCEGYFSVGPSFSPELTSPTAQAPTATPETTPIISETVIGNPYKPNVSGEVIWTFNTSNAFQKRAATSLIKSFENKYPDVEVSLDSSAVSPERILSGTIGDIFYMEDAEVYKYAVTYNSLMPLDGYIASLQMDTTEIPEVIYKSGKVNNHIYYVASEYNQLCFSYNKSVLSSLGLDLLVDNNWSWSTLHNIAKSVTEFTADSGSPYYGADIDLTYSPIYTALLEISSNGTWCDMEGRKITFADFMGNNLRLIEDCIEAAMSGYINPGIASKTVGQPVFKIIRHGQVMEIGKEYDSQGVMWDFVAFPGLSQADNNHIISCSSSGFGVYNRTHNPDTAAVFALHLYTEDGQLAFNGQSGGSVPIIKSIQNTDVWKYPDEADWTDKNWDAFIYQEQSSEYIIGQVVCRLPYIIASNIEDTMPKIISNVMNGNAALYDEFVRLETYCNELWSIL